MVELSSLLPEVSGEQAQRWLRVWHGGRDGYVVVTRISSAGRHVVRSWAFGVEDLIESFEGEKGISGLSSLCSDAGGNWNVYVSCSTHDVDPTGEHGQKRGGKATISAMHGVWLDLDIKDEGFASSEDVDTFIRSLPIRPTAVVDSGSGGRHVYWRFTEPVARDEGERLCTAWWAFCKEQAGGVYIDKVTTSDRIMRIPGTIRWPKKPGEDLGRVTLLWDGGPRTEVSAVMDTAGGAWERYLEQTRHVAERAHSDASLAGLTLEKLIEAEGWDQLVALSQLEEVFNETVSWDRILIPAGWRYVGSDYEGRRHWARPGQSGKSAHTDYPPSPHVMNLFSNSPETGLSALYDAGIVLSKLRVYCVLHYGGDMKRLVEGIVRGEFLGGQVETRREYLR